MGLFSKVLGAATFGLAGDSPFKGLRSGATQAAKQAKAAGEQSLADQMALKEEIGDIYDPRIQAGTQAFGDLNQFYSGNQQPIVDQAMSSPFMNQLVNSGENAIARKCTSNRRIQKRHDTRKPSREQSKRADEFSKPSTAR